MLTFACFLGRSRLFYHILQQCRDSDQSLILHPRSRSVKNFALVRRPARHAYHEYDFMIADLSRAVVFEYFAFIFIVTSTNCHGHLGCCVVISLKADTMNCYAKAACHVRPPCVVMIMQMLSYVCHGCMSCLTCFACSWYPQTHIYLQYIAQQETLPDSSIRARLTCRQTFLCNKACFPNKRMPQNFFTEAC